MKIRVAHKGEKIIDLNGYIYVAEEIYPNYISIGNGEFITHGDYYILPHGLEKEVENLACIAQKISSDYGFDTFNAVFNQILTRMDYVKENKVDPRHVWTFEEYEEHEGDIQYNDEIFKRDTSCR